MTLDDRRLNSRKSPSLQHKIRVVVGSKKNPIAYGMTFPKFIVERFEGCMFRIYTSGNSIVLESGCKLHPQDIDTTKTNCFYGMRMHEDKFGGIELVK